MQKIFLVYFVLWLQCKIRKPGFLKHVETRSFQFSLISSNWRTIKNITHTLLSLLLMETHVQIFRKKNSKHSKVKLVKLELQEIFIVENKRNGFLKTVSVWLKLNTWFFIGEPVQSSKKKIFASIKNSFQPLHLL